MTLQKNTILRFALAALVLIACAALLILNASRAHGALTKDEQSLVNTYRTYEFFQSSTTAGVLNSVVATGTVGTALSNGFTSFNDPQGQLNTGVMDIRGAKKVSLFFTRGGAFGAANLGTTTFSVEVTPDGTNWYAFNKLVQATSTSVSNSAVQSSVLIGATTPGNAATSTGRFSMDLSTEGFQGLRCKAVTTVDGAASCMGAATF